MSDAAYQNALAKRDRLLKELEEVNNFLKLYQRFSPKTSKPDQGDGGHQEAASGTKGAPPRSGSTPERFEPYIRSALITAGRPLPRGELLERLKAAGNPIPGEYPAKNLGTIMWRLKDKFVTLPGAGYWIMGVAMPEFGYNPPGAKSFDEAMLEYLIS